MFVSKFRGGKSRHSAFQIEPLEQRRLLSAVMLKYSWEGDSNLDGTVNALDFNALATGYGNNSANWLQGDFNEDGTVNSADFASLATDYGAPTVTTLGVKLLKLEGQFNGHYTSTTTGTHAISFDITACTHTGHFTGTVEFTNDQGKFPATVKGAISASHHVDLSYSGDGFSGTITGNATHTNGSFSGDYANTTGPVSHGTYHVAKA